ncbi:Nucleotide/sugar transporter family protein [Zea mays]|jgi:hypothetical protein|uniref:Nucleotide/sugar transporter family protein n=1 Tax=Zea mays TaxID=4577 RepID=A0A1D6FM70_MAIZE|nr:Nucleotide/sugar transporter family protein [Zea mays]
MGVGGEKFQLGTVGALSLSVVSSVSIVICNKALMSSLGFNFGVRSDCFLPQFLDLLCVCSCWMFGDSRRFACSIRVVVLVHEMCTQDSALQTVFAGL